MTQRNPLPQARRRHRRAPAVALCLLACPLAHAAGVKVEIRGVDEELRANVLVYLSFERYKKGGADLNADTIERLHNRVEREVQSALRPFGYYEPQVDSSVSDLGHGDWRVIININPGKPVLVAHIDVRVDGSGENDPLFQRILRHLPLHDGERLEHAAYESIKTDLQRTAATYGYLDARLIRHELAVHPPNPDLRLAVGRVDDRPAAYDARAEVAVGGRGALQVRLDALVGGVLEALAIVQRQVPQDTLEQRIVFPRAVDAHVDVRDQHRLARVDVDDDAPVAVAQVADAGVDLRLVVAEGSEGRLHLALYAVVQPLDRVGVEVRAALLVALETQVDEHVGAQLLVDAADL